jgi:hypothetical protein
LLFSLKVIFGIQTFDYNLIFIPPFYFNYLYISSYSSLSKNKLMYHFFPKNEKMKSKKGKKNKYPFCMMCLHLLLKLSMSTVHGPRSTGARKEQHDV